MRILTLAAVLVTIHSCNSDKIYKVDRFDDELLVCSGKFILDSLSHEVSIDYASKIGQENQQCYTATFKIMKSGDTVNFSLSDSGTYITSESTPFLAGEEFVVSIENNNQVYTKTCYFPSNMSTNGQKLDKDNGTLSLSFDSPKDQYIYYEIFWGYPDNFLDTVWYSATVQKSMISIPKNKWIDFQLPKQRNSEGGEGSGLTLAPFAIKVEYDILDYEAGMYFSALDEYLNGNQPNSRMTNPPVFYDDGVYGITYGSIDNQKIIISI